MFGVLLKLQNAFPFALPFVEYFGYFSLGLANFGGFNLLVISSGSV